MKQGWFLGVLLLMPLGGEGAVTMNCTNHLFLQGGFRIQDYKQCKQAIEGCPIQGVIPEQSCVKRILNARDECKQFAATADVLKMPASAISAKQFDAFTVIDEIFYADGQHQYYIITPQGCMVNTNIDPRSVDTEFANKYNNMELMTVNSNPPSYQANPDGSHEFIVQLRMTAGCLACQLIGDAAVKYVFPRQSTQYQVSLEKFVPATVG